jgi:hypothetical protein
MEQEIQQLKTDLKSLKSELQEYKKKVDNIYSPTQFPEQILNILYKKGLIRITDTLIYSGVTGVEFTDFIVDISDKQYIVQMTPFENYIPFTVNTSTDVVSSNRDLESWVGEGNTVTIISTNTLPSPLTTSLSYMVKNISGSTCDFYDSTGATKVNFTTAGVGKHYITSVF